MSDKTIEAELESLRKYCSHDLRAVIGRALSFASLSKEEEDKGQYLDIIVKNLEEALEKLDKHLVDIDSLKTKE